MNVKCNIACGGAYEAFDVIFMKFYNFFSKEDSCESSDLSWASIMRKVAQSCK